MLESAGVAERCKRSRGTEIERCAGQVKLRAYVSVQQSTDGERFDKRNGEEVR